MADLPQELIDKIIDEIAQRNFVDTLRACCLVQKRWVERSRSHLFQDIDLYFKVRFGGWVESIPLGPNSPHRHVRSLTYRQHTDVIGPEQLLDLHPGHFTSFMGLKNLRIFNLSLPRFTPTSMKEAFGPVGSSVRELVVHNVALTLNSLSMFLIHFPRLEVLHIGEGGLEVTSERGEQPQNLPNFTGELILTSVRYSQAPSVLGLSNLPLRYSKLDVEFKWNSDVLNAIAHLILACSPTLEKLTLRYSRALFAEDAEEVYPLDLKSCVLLREIAVQVPEHEAEEHLVHLLGTIRSHELETIRFMGLANIVRPSAWVMVDDVLCALVDRLEEDGWKGRLRVMTHHSKRLPPGACEGNLAGFRKKGEVIESESNPF